MSPTRARVSFARKFLYHSSFYIRLRLFGERKALWFDLPTSSVPFSFCYRWPIFYVNSQNLRQRKRSIMNCKSGGGEECKVCKGRYHRVEFACSCSNEAGRMFVRFNYPQIRSLIIVLFILKMDMQKSRKMWVSYMNANESFNISVPFAGHIVWVSHLSHISFNLLSGSPLQDLYREDVRE
jgi:hypothetical protein